MLKLCWILPLNGKCKPFSHFRKQTFQRRKQCSCNKKPLLLCQQEIDFNGIRSETICQINKLRWTSRHVIRKALLANFLFSYCQEMFLYNKDQASHHFPNLILQSLCGYCFSIESIVIYYKHKIKACWKKNCTSPTTFQYFMIFKKTKPLESKLEKVMKIRNDEEKINNLWAVFTKSAIVCNLLDWDFKELNRTSVVVNDKLVRLGKEFNVTSSAHEGDKGSIEDLCGWLNHFILRILNVTKDYYLEVQTFRRHDGTYYEKSMQ